VSRVRGAAFLLGLAAVAAASFGAAPQRAGILPAATSSFVPRDQLAAHGIDLAPVPASLAAAAISIERAVATAREITGLTPPRESFRVLASPTSDEPRRTAWLLLFEGGPGPISAGPPDGAYSRRFATDYTGVLVDDQTGVVLRWFQGGSLRP
jgi:hypothetical protein